jgi:CrcB protein
VVGCLPSIRFEELCHGNPAVACRRSGRASLLKYFLIAFGGAFGSMARYWLGSAIANRLGTRFPFGTLFINLTACAVIGFSLTLLTRHAGINAGWRFVGPVGFIGAFSTFSTLEWETLSAMRNGAILMAALYAIGSFILGFAAVWGGSMIAQFIS